MRADLDSAKEQIVSLLEEGVPRLEICRIYKCKYDSLKSRLDKWGITIKNQSRKGREHPEAWKSVEEFLTEFSIIGSHRLKIRLWRAKLKPKHCELCGWAQYSVDGRLPLELDHINGNHYDNRIENLRILCPNCHALQLTNSGCNAGKLGSVAQLEEALRLGRSQ